MQPRDVPQSIDGMIQRWTLDPTLDFQRSALDSTGMPDQATLADAVATEVRAEMARQRMSGRAVADALGVSHMYLSRRINGHVPFDVAELQRIAAVLGVPVSKLLPTVDATP